MSSMLALLLLKPGMMPSGTQSIVCCPAKIMNCCKVESLSPEYAPDTVKPAASLSFQPWVNHTLALASINFFISAETEPM